MAGIKELKSRIKSVSDTQKITNAMYLVACAKYSSTHDEAVKFAVYFDALEKQTKAVLGGMESGSSIYTDTNRSGDRICFAVGSDKGMAGDYNKSVFKEVQKLYNEFPGTVIYAVGEKVRKLLKNAGIPYAESFDFVFRKPDDETAQYISDMFTGEYADGKISSVTAVYTDSSSGSAHKVIRKQILPISTESNGNTDCEFIPSKSEIADVIIPVYFKGVIRNILLQSFYNEQSSRMEAMKAANDNAKDLISELTLQYNHTRQNAITAEITEISGERNRK